MKLGKTFYAKDRKAWRAWLAAHHDKESEIWLVYPRAATGKPRVAYEEAVEEALCFGWIDSTTKGIDDESFAQRFSPRRPKSNWSQPNIQRMRRLIAAGQMTPAGLAVLHDKTLLKRKRLEVAPDVLRALKKDPEVWRAFQKLPQGYKWIRLTYIESQRRHGKEAFDRSLAFFIHRTRAGKQYIFGQRKKI